jgi:tetratricopeptide (TPR) repeat protein
MSKHPFFFFFAAALIMLCLSACSNTRDGFMYRVYHNTNARFNGYYYAMEAMKEADVILKDGYEENWDEILPVFPPVDESTAQEVYPLMELAIEKCTNVVDKHTMSPSRRNQKDIKRPELNKWIDENYDIIARAHLIKGDEEKALEIFQYLVRTLDYPDAQAWANAWMARTYMAMEDRVKASNTLIKAAQIDEVDDQAVRAYVFQVYAAYHLKNEEVEAAIGKLEKSLLYIEKNQDKARTLFILGQCYESIGQSQDAIERYNQVVELRTPYELEFYSKIKQAMAFDRRGGNSEPIVELLEDLLDDNKNEIYQDQIFYALAILAIEERRRDDGVNMLMESLLANTDNTRQRMKSYLLLGDLFMEDLDYTNAQAYYDSARTFMEEDNGRFDEVDAMADNLTDLVDNLVIIETQDSLLGICDLSEEDRDEKITQIIEDLEAEVERRRLAAEAAALAEMESAGNGGSGMFWPYNSQLKVAGRRNFRDYWGDRILEDNWRRSMKMMASFSSEVGDGRGDVLGKEKAPDISESEEIPTEEELLAGLPCDSLERLASIAMIAEAYYNAGLDYKEKLSDLENAIDTWTELVERMDDSDFHPTTYYQLYRTYLQRELEENFLSPFCESCNSEYWSALVLDKYPNTEWSLLIENPEFADKKEMIKEEERLEYEGRLMRYYAKEYQNILLECNDVIEGEVANNYLCKYQLLRAQCVGGLSAYAGGDRKAYYEALRDVVRQCEESEEGAFAKELLADLGQSGVKEPIQPKEVKEEVVEVPWIHKPYLEHYFGMLVPVGRGNVEELRATIADFNSEFYNSKKLRVTANLIDRNFQIVLIKSFVRQDYSLDYFEVFNNNDDALEKINSSGYRNFVISTENYVEMFKNKQLDSYILWFENIYLQGTK